MEQETILKEILSTLKEYGESTDKKLVQMEDRMDKRFVQLEEKVDKGFASTSESIDKLGKRIDGTRVELTDTKETTDFLPSKVAKHEKRLR